MKRMLQNHRRQRAHRSLIVTALLCVLNGPAPAEELPELDCVILPHQEVDVHSAVPGIIQSIAVERSDTVGKDQILAQLDARVEQATLELAQARAQMDTEIFLRAANLDYDQRRRQRAEALYGTKAMSVDARDEAARDAALSEWELGMARDKKRLAELEMERARAVLELRTIRSPLSGVVVTRYRSPGEYVEDQPILRVAQLDPLRVEVIAPVSMYSRVRKGMPVQIHPETDPERSYTATVSIIDAVADPASGTFGMRLDLPNPRHRLLGGIKCKSRFAPAKRVSNRVTAPARLPATAKTESLAPAADTRRCRSAGPFTDPTQATGLQNALSALSIDARLRQSADAGELGYVVVSPAQETRAARKTLSTRMQESGIDDQLIMDVGQFRDRIALGYYQGRSWAERRQAQLAELGYETEILTSGSATPEWWLDLPASAAGQEQQVRLALSDHAPGAALQRRVCESLSTADAR